MADFVVTTTKKGIAAIELGTYSLCRRHIAILIVASRKPSPAINQVCREVRKMRDVALTTESLTQDIAELHLRNLLRVHQ